MRLIIAKMLGHRIASRSASNRLVKGCLNPGTFNWGRNLGIFLNPSACAFEDQRRTVIKRHALDQVHIASASNRDLNHIGTGRKPAKRVQHIASGRRHLIGQFGENSCLINPRHIAAKSCLAAASF